MKYLIISLLFFAPLAVFAQSVTNFVASPSTAISGQAVDFSWTLSNAGGYSFKIPCIPGIKLKNATLNSMACDTPISSTAATSDTVRVYISNVTGSTASVAANLIPKDASGNDYNAGAQSISVSMSTNPRPITSFNTSATTTTSGQAVNISWTSQDIDGVNLQVDCSDFIKVSSSNYGSGNLPCATPVFSSVFSPNGSAALNFTNSSPSPQSYKLTLLPTISTSPLMYDGTHAAYLTLTVASDMIPDPIVNSLTASSTSLNSGDQVSVSWVTQNTQGVNFKISCRDSVTATSSQSSSLNLPCDNYAFANFILPSVGTTTFAFQNTGVAAQNVILTLFPVRKDGNYDATRSSNITLNVRQAVAPTPVPVPVSTPVAAATSSPVTTPAVTTAPVVPPAPSTPAAVANFAKTLFTQTLRYGSRGVQVKALQTFLKTNPSIYPEGVVNGVFGPATERAVKRFQKKYEIVSSGSPNTTGYGMVGTRTRAKLNELQ